MADAGLFVSRCGLIMPERKARRWLVMPERIQTPRCSVSRFTSQSLQHQSVAFASTKTLMNHVPNAVWPCYGTGMTERFPYNNQSQSLPAWSLGWPGWRRGWRSAPSQIGRCRTGSRSGSSGSSPRPRSPAQSRPAGSPSRIFCRWRPEILNIKLISCIVWWYNCQCKKIC